MHSVFKLMERSACLLLQCLAKHFVFKTNQKGTRRKIVNCSFYYRFPTNQQNKSKSIDTVPVRIRQNTWSTRKREGIPLESSVFVFAFWNAIVRILSIDKQVEQGPCQIHLSTRKSDCPGLQCLWTCFVIMFSLRSFAYLLDPYL